MNEDPSFAFNKDGAKFPSPDEQRNIAAGLKLNSGVDFHRIILAVDGMLVWTTEPSKADCEFLQIGQRLFHCYRKDKYG